MSNDNIEHDLDLENPTGDFNSDYMLKLIAILKNAETEYREVEAGDEHSHPTFDHADIRALDALEQIIRDKHKPDEDVPS